MSPGLFGDLFEDGEIARVPGLCDEVELAVVLAHDGVVDVLEVGETEILFDHDCGNELVVFHDVDGGAFAAVGAVEGTDDGVFAVVIDVAGEGAEGHAEGGEVVTVAGEAVDFGVGAIGDVNAGGAGEDGDAVSGAELAGAGASSAEGEIVPGGFEGVGAFDFGGEDEVEIRVAGGDIVEAVELVGVGGDEIAAAAEVVVSDGVAEVGFAVRGIEGVNEFSVGGCGSAVVS